MSTFYIGKKELTDSLQACVRVDIEAFEIVTVFGNESLWVEPELIQVWKQFYE